MNYYNEDNKLVINLERSNIGAYNDMLFKTINGKCKKLLKVINKEIRTIQAECNTADGNAGIAITTVTRMETDLRRFSIELDEMINFLPKHIEALTKDGMVYEDFFPFDVKLSDESCQYICNAMKELNLIYLVCNTKKQDNFKINLGLM